MESWWMTWRRKTEHRDGGGRTFHPEDIAVTIRLTHRKCLSTLMYLPT